MNAIIVGTLLTPIPHFLLSVINIITNSSNNSSSSSSVMITGQGGSATPLGTGRDGGQKVNQSRMATDQTVAISLTGTSQTGRAIRVTGMVTRVTAGVTGVTGREGSRGETGSTARQGNQPSTRSTDWRADAFNPMVNPSMVLVVLREIRAVGRGAGQGRW